MNSISSTDRLSNLPNNLISHILSFLSTKDAVRTSILSTQWIHQWTSITHLDFGDCYLRGTGNSFLNFVYRVLLFKMTRLDLFRLKSWSYYDVAHVNLWLSVALSRHVRQIDLNVPLYHFPLPAVPGPAIEPRPHVCLFMSITLVILKLGREFLLRVPNIVSLDSLKILHLNSVEFEDSESLSRLVSSCPVIEELKMEGELGKNMDVLSISSLVLKRLILNGLYDKPDLRPYKVVLNTPSLEYFEHVDDGVPEGYHVEMKTLHCLDRAHLSNVFFTVNSMADLAVAISNVRSLYISESDFEGFYPTFQLPYFSRLTDLKIDGVGELLVAFLQASPQLDDEDFEDWKPPTTVPFCMQQNLKVIEVNYFTGLPLELSMMEYFLGKTISLEKLIISASPKEDSTLIKKQLFNLPKASKSCKVEFTTC